MKDNAMLTPAAVETDGRRFRLLSVVCLLGMLAVVSPTDAWHSVGHQGENLPVAHTRHPPVRHSLLGADCAHVTGLPSMSWPAPDEVGEGLCANPRDIPSATRTAGAHHTDDTREPDLKWRSVEDTQKLHPTAGPSLGISWYGTFDGEVSTLNLPLVGTTLVASSGGFFNFGTAAGIGIGGIYLQAGVDFPLYYKYPNFWSINFVLGTAYNLGLFLQPTFQSTGFWGGGPEFILELGLLRIQSVLGFGIAGRYCTESFMCDVGPGLYVSLGISLIEETTGLPSQR